jgi:ATP-binding cassette subfamily F protein 3
VWLTCLELTEADERPPFVALLTALANKQIPGVPLNLRILLLGQTRQLSAEEAIGGLSIEEESVLQHVIRSDAVREQYTREANCE